MTQVVEAYDPRVAGSGNQIPHLARYASECSRAGIQQCGDHPAGGRLARSLLALGDQDRTGQTRTQSGNQKGPDQGPTLIVKVEEWAQFLQTSARQGFRQRLRPAGSSKLHRRPRYHPPALAVDINCAPSPVAEIEIEP